MTVIDFTNIYRLFFFAHLNHLCCFMYFMVAVWIKAKAKFSTIGQYCPIVSYSLS